MKGLLLAVSAGATGGVLGKGYIFLRDNENSFLFGSNSPKEEQVRDEKRAYRANLVEEAKKLKGVAATTAINKVASSVAGDNANKNGDNNTNQVKVEINPTSSNSISSPQTSEPSPTASSPIDVGNVEPTAPAGVDIGPDPVSPSPLEGLMPEDIF
ncbi:hypothetical protein MSUIS_05530 [Mycoplasma suis KI3806]|uniref:Uncharacterized protein n=1 Tax=Mycoplasma suis (strain KI_3806) TaxID=708248 RepID=F0V1W5_MYCS3|nr:hypothetical protein MSUIS_05530 [Mycoplasma suis KI3806]